MVRAYFHLLVPVPLLAVLAFELASPMPRLPGMPARDAAARPIRPAAPDARAQAAIALARPLFSAHRRPAIAAPKPVPRPPRLSGIVVAGAARYAIFVADGDTPMIAAKGQSIGPFEVRDITTTLVIVSGPGGIVTLRTSYSEGAPGGAAPAASPPPKAPAPVVLPGGITLYPATPENLPDAASWPGTSE